MRDLKAKCLRVFVAVGVTFFAYCAHAQRITFDSPHAIGVSHLTGRITVGADPDNLSQLFNLLKDAEVCEALDLSDAQKSVLKEIKASHEELIRSELDQKTSPHIIVGKLRGSAKAVVEELLTPAQMKRMRQIIFRIEAAVIGLPDALTEGRLQAAAGVHENQFTRIRERGAEIEAKARAEIMEILKRAEAELLAELAPEQRDAAKAALGDFFVYSNVQGMRRSVEEIREKQKMEKADSPKKP